jgi:tetratricopeptide (TPR) repeat protein
MTMINAEFEVDSLVARAKRDKEEAKDLRDSGDYAGAVALLTETVKTLMASPLEAGLESAVEASKSMRDLATQLADCLGMLGGNYRRLGKLKEAQGCFERGRRYEESPALEVMSSYNLVNAITLPIEADPNSLPTQRSQIEKAVAAISRQVRSDRRNDRWAWADLALCQLLLGDQNGAKQSYSRVRDLGDDDTVQSVVAVLNRLAKAAPTLENAIANVVAILKG